MPKLPELVPAPESENTIVFELSSTVFPFASLRVSRASEVFPDWIDADESTSALCEVETAPR